MIFDRFVAVGLTLLGLYVATYFLFLAAGVFDLAGLPWSDQRGTLLYRFYLPLERIREGILSQADSAGEFAPGQRNSQESNLTRQP